MSEGVCRKDKQHEEEATLGDTNEEFWNKKILKKKKKKEILKINLTKEQKMVWGIQLVLGNTRFKRIIEKIIFRFLRKQF